MTLNYMRRHLMRRVRANQRKDGSPLKWATVFFGHKMAVNALL